MTRSWTKVAAFAVALVSALAVTAVAQQPAAQPSQKKSDGIVKDLTRMWKWAAEPRAKSVKPEQVVEGFLKSLQERKDLGEAKRGEITKLVQTQAADPERRASAITEAVAAIQPEFATALAALADEDIAKAAPILKKLMESSDDFVKAEAAYFLARAYAMEENCEAALPLLKELTGKLAEKTLYGGDALYLLGACHTQLLHRSEAIAALERFLKQHPDAAERLRVGAFRQLEELKAMKNGSLVDVEDRMVFSRRKLDQEDAGDRTREEQSRIVAMLDKLIKEAEQRECSGCCSGGGAGRGGRGGANPGAGARQSTAPQGPASVGPTVTRTNNRNAWDTLRERDREKVLAGLKGKFPDRYKKLIEQYYKNLQEEER
jgi:tetratricopeptide (TPR) repeat protein